jgi:single-strand DNA-binding protein
MSVNKVILLGNLGKDPIVRKLDNGRSVAQFSLATNEKYKDKTGALQTKTEWHNIVMWSPLAEIAEKYLKKGAQVYLEGKIETREYTDKEGQTKRITEVVARELSLVGGGSGNGSGNDSSESTKAEAVSSMAAAPDDDLPF